MSLPGCVSPSPCGSGSAGAVSTRFCLRAFFIAPSPTLSLAPLRLPFASLWFLRLVSLLGRARQSYAVASRVASSERFVQLRIATKQT